MKLKEISVGKEFKIGLPNFSNITLRTDLKWELEADEEPNWDAMWDEVNKQLSQQSASLDPSWITKNEYKNFFKVSVKTPKGGEGA